MRGLLMAMTAAWFSAVAPVQAQQQPAAEQQQPTPPQPLDPLLGQFGSVLEVAPPPPEAARLANLLSSSLAAIQPQRPRRLDVYLVVAALWDTPVFESEAVQVEQILREHLGAEGRSIILTGGSGRGQRRFPNATPANISAAIGHVASVMDPNQDLFVLFITSHGSPDGSTSLRQRSRLDGNLRPISLSAMLSQANIRNRVIIVSSCFSGAFIPPLQNEDTIVMTAAAADRTSFGCEPERDWTYFGDAYFNRAIRNGASLIDGFDQAKAQITTWETEQHLTPSNPQSAIGANAAALLRQAERAAR